ncbi:MAG: NAD(P)H-dependent oxidoreductase [Candidatus Omnitrophica bacterium]|nr:NAD(P)H-dependent oxidoreductase [Candidatus Omnitrophota bacterium]
MKKISIAVIGGSLRPQSYTMKALNIIVQELQRHPHVVIEMIDPRDLPLSLALPGSPSQASFEESLKKRVSSAMGFILATPEYHGSCSSIIKLIIENFGYPSVLEGKPVALVGVADGQIGAVKALEHLQSTCIHIGALVLPGAVSIAHVQNLFNAHGHCLDKDIEKRLRGLANHLIQYVGKHISPHAAFEETVRGKE